MSTTEAADAAKSLKLGCAYCSKEFEVSEILLIEGSDVLCPHCGAECVLEREWLGHGGHSRWILVEGGDDDEP